MQSKKRHKLGIIFNNTNDNWIGGTYYFLNLICALKTLPDAEKPEITLFSWDKKDLDIFNKIGYEYIKHISLELSFSLNYIEKKVFSLFPNLIKRYKKYLSLSFPSDIVDVVFPYDFNVRLRKIKKKIFWIPDFQDYYLPEFFNDKELEERKNLYNRIASQKNATLVLSSKSSKSDFINHHPDAKCYTKVVSFAVTHPNFDYIDFSIIKRKYKINDNYFIVPNQLWAHKNHMIVLNAVLYLKKKNYKIIILFTGKEYDYRNPEYTNTLKNYVHDNDLTDNIKFLGFIDRLDLLKLMQESIAVIQPSFFEGWSTVIEDAKAIGKSVIASDLDVHKEQLGDSGIYFNPNDYHQLADLIIQHNLILSKKSASDYLLNIEKFAKTFIELLEINR
jgi:glycosyltransferase involved in cell wall biosynthesis